MLSVAGCTAIASQTTLSDPTIEQEDHGETHLTFNTDGERLAVITIQPGRRRYSGHGGDSTPVDIQIWHRDPTKIDSLKLRLRAPPSGVGPPAQVALTAPPWTPHPSIQLYTDRQDSSTIFEIDEMGDQGDGTMPFEFALSGLEKSTSELFVDAAVGLTEQGVLGQNYSLEGRTRTPLPDSDDTS